MNSLQRHSTVLGSLRCSPAVRDRLQAATRTSSSSSSSSSSLAFTTDKKQLMATDKAQTSNTFQSQMPMKPEQLNLLKQETDELKEQVTILQGRVNKFIKSGVSKSRLSQRLIKILSRIEHMKTKYSSKMYDDLSDEEVRECRSLFHVLFPDLGNIGKTSKVFFISVRMKMIAVLYNHEEFAEVLKLLENFSFDELTSQEIMLRAKAQLNYQDKTLIVQTLEYLFHNKQFNRAFELGESLVLKSLNQDKNIKESLNYLLFLLKGLSNSRSQLNHKRLELIANLIYNYSLHDDDPNLTKIFNHMPTDKVRLKVLQILLDHSHVKDDRVFLENLFEEVRAFKDLDKSSSILRNIESSTAELETICAQPDQTHKRYRQAFDIIYPNPLTRDELQLLIDYLMTRRRYRAAAAALFKFKALNYKITIRYYNTLLLLKLMTSTSDEFFKTFEELSRSFKPDSKSYLRMMQRFHGNNDLHGQRELFHFLLQKKFKFHISHFTTMISTCKRQLDEEQLLEFESAREKLSIDADDGHVAALMDFYLITRNYRKVEELFNKFPKQRSLKIYSQLVKKYVEQGDFEGAKSIYMRLISLDVEPTAEFYEAIIIYFCRLEEFEAAEYILNSLTGRNSQISASHYATLMKFYLRKKKLRKVLNVYNQMMENEIKASPDIYRLVLETLVRLDFANKSNFTKPLKIAEEIVAAHRSTTMPFTKPILKFKIVKSVIHYLARYYDPNEAVKLIETYEVSRSIQNFETIDSLREDAITLAESGQWDLFNKIFDRVLRNVLQKSEDQPFNRRFKKILTVLLRYRFSYLADSGNTGKIKEFIEEHVFSKDPTRNILSFTNSTWNYAVSLLLTDSSTMRFGLFLIERKLIGGYIAMKIKRQLYFNNLTDKTEEHGIQPSLVLSHENFFKAYIEVDKVIEKNYKNGQGISTTVAAFERDYSNLMGAFARRNLLPKENHINNS